ncbi:hypothetical protein WG904_05715 [Pedobacter sp. Du54]|uniref:hypothetical protein n=1 Tax=Pedobacter anseongensis TaxID=3133439 RepID=UPI00309DAD6E
MTLTLLRISSLLLLAIQVNAKQSIANPQPIVSVENKITSDVSTTVVVAPLVNVVLDTKQSTNLQDQAPQKIKLFTKSFAVDKNDKINLSNEYGALNIKTWDKNEIKVDAEIKAYANTDSEAQKLLDLTSISTNKTGDVISFMTDIDLKNNWTSGSKKREVKVFMTVYMPSANVLKASQEYGDLLIGDYSGPTTLAVEYGTLTTGELKSSTNVIRVEYGKANIKSVNQAKISHEYGSGTTIGSAGTLSINAEYTNIKLGSVKGKAIVNLEYAKLSADNINSSFAVTADYSTVSLGFDPAFKAVLNVATNYGSFKYGTNANVRRQTTGDEDRYSSKRNYTGDIGKGDNNSGQSVSVRSEYTHVIFK